MKNVLDNLVIMHYHSLFNDDSLFQEGDVVTARTILPQAFRLYIKIVIHNRASKA